MNIKMAINSQLLTTDSKKQTKQTSRTETESQMWIIWMATSWEGGGGKWGKRYRD